MKIAVLHSASLGFFPRFYQDLCSSADRVGDEIMCFSPNSGQNRRRTLKRQVLWGYRWNWFVHSNIYRVTGIQDYWSPISTLDLIRKLSAYNPDVVHMHIVNQCDTCMPLLIDYLNNNNIPVVWTMHDCRAFTGRCAYFDEIGCEKWKTGCGNCPEKTLYSPTKIDASALQWRLRKNLLNKIKNLTIVTPSQWLANLVKQSFLNEKSLIVINNGIDTSEFSLPVDRNIIALENIKEKIVLGVASVWEQRKGLDSMIWLSQHLPEGYQLVLVGGMSADQQSRVPANIISLPRTNSKEELIAIYQRADVFVNPTLADNFPTVNIEALGAGLPVITFKTGGSAECLDETCGIAVEKGNNESLLKAVLEVCSNPDRYTKEKCIKRSQSFSLMQFDKYIELYHKLVERK